MVTKTNYKRNKNILKEQRLRRDSSFNAPNAYLHLEPPRFEWEFFNEGLCICGHISSWVWVENLDFFSPNMYKKNNKMLLFPKKISLASHCFAHPCCMAPSFNAFLFFFFVFLSSFFLKYIRHFFEGRFSPIMIH